MYKIVLFSVIALIVLYCIVGEIVDVVAQVRSGKKVQIFLDSVNIVIIAMILAIGVGYIFRQEVMEVLEVITGLLR